MWDFLQRSTGLNFSVFCYDNIAQTPVAGCFGTGGAHGSVTYLDMLMTGWMWTLMVAGGALVLALVVGSLIGILRTLPNNPKLNAFALGWVEFFRNIPLLVQVFLWYFVVPALIPAVDLWLRTNGKVGAMLLVVCALGFFTSARIAEQLRSGIEALPRGQRYAALALGMSTAQSYRLVLLPVAYRMILPPLTSETMNVFKNASIAVAVGITELVFMAQQIAEETASPTESYLAVTVLFFISAMAANRIMAWVEQRLRIPGLVVPTGGGQ